MNCNEARDLLSEYIDQTLTDAEREAVEAHISTCSECREGKEALAQLVADVASLDTVEAPPGFSQRVMSKIKEEEINPGFWERVFLPLKVKIPIQVVGLFLVAGLAVYLYRINPVNEKQGLLVAPQDSDQSSQKETLSSKDSRLNESQNMDGNEDMATIENLSTFGNGSAPAPKTIDAIKPGVSVLNQDKSGVIRKSDAKQEAFKAPSSVPSSLSNQVVADSMITEKESIVVMAEPAEKQIKKNLAADLELHLTPVASVELVEIRKNLAVFVQDLGGKTIDQPELTAGFRIRADDVGDMLWVRLPRTNLNQFKTKLSSLGEVTLGKESGSQKMVQAFRLEESREDGPRTKKQKVPKEQSATVLIKILIQPSIP